MVWTCLPQFDSDPAFCSLLMPENPTPAQGIYAIELIDFERAEQSYIRNTAIVQTTLYDKHGNAESDLVQEIAFGGEQKDSQRRKAWQGVLDQSLVNLAEIENSS